MFSTSCKTEGAGNGPLFKEYWTFRQHWLDYVKRQWTGAGRVEQDKTENPEIIEFRARAEKAFTERQIPFRYVKTYLSIQVPKTGVGMDVSVKTSHIYDDHYPHTHEPPNATTLIHYLQPGDEPAPLDVFDEDEVVETIYPEKGLTVFMPNNVKHGVRLNQGETDRIQLIATALR